MRPVLSEAVHFISGRRKIKFMPPTEAKLHFSGGDGSLGRRERIKVSCDRGESYHN